MGTNRSTGDVETMIREACTKANGALTHLLPDGPTKALLALYVARAEVLRIAEERFAFGVNYCDIRYNRRNVLHAASRRG